MTLNDWQRVAREFGDKDFEFVDDAEIRWVTYDDEWTVGEWLPSEPTAKEILRLRKRVEVLERVREAAADFHEYQRQVIPFLGDGLFLSDELGEALDAAKEAADGD